MQQPCHVVLLSVGVKFSLVFVLLFPVRNKNNAPALGLSTNLKKMNLLVRNNVETNSDGQVGVGSVWGSETNQPMPHSHA